MIVSFLRKRIPPSPTSADLIAVWRKLDEVQILFQDHDEIVWKPSPNGLYSLRLEPGACILSSGFMA